jgi:hypothetical protein
MPKSSTQRLAANRANAAKSTGPRIPAGKAHSSQNARKHIFTGSTFAVVRLEDLQEIARLRDDLIAVYQPVNSQELFALGGTGTDGTFPWCASGRFRNLDRDLLA